MAALRNARIFLNALLDLVWIKRLQWMGCIFLSKGAAVVSSGDAVHAICGVAAAICFAADALIESRHK